VRLMRDDHAKTRFHFQHGSIKFLRLCQTPGVRTAVRVEK
jgi:hypothetical protein